MLDLHQLPPPPRGVKHIVPSPGDDARKETSDFYGSVIAILASRWRVIACRNGIQWILQKRTAEPLHKGIWRGQSYHTNRNGLIEACARLELSSEAKFKTVLQALPENASECRPKRS